MEFIWKYGLCKIYLWGDKKECLYTVIRLVEIQ